MKKQITITSAFLLLVNTLAFTSCKSNNNNNNINNDLKTISVNWRTEEYTGNVGNSLTPSREYIWETQPSVKGGQWKVKDGYALPDGIALLPKGNLTGIPTLEGEYRVSFVYSVSGYKDAVSPELFFKINAANTPYTNATWATNNFAFHCKTTVTKESSTQRIATAFAAGTSFYVRQGFSLPEGLTLDESTGKIYGTPAQVGKKDVSFVAKSKGKNNIVSGIYTVSVFVNHLITIQGTGSDVNSNKQMTTTNLTIDIPSISYSPFSSFNSIFNWLHNNHFTSNEKTYTGCSGQDSDGYKFNGIRVSNYYNDRFVTDATKTTGADTATRSAYWINGDITMNFYIIS